MATSLVILAAGVGRRYGGLKQLEPVGPSGEAILEYSICDALRTGLDRVVLVIREETEVEFREFLGPRLDPRVDLVYVHQRLSDGPQGLTLPIGRSKPWGTGHAVLAAAPVIDGPFAVINADDFYGSQSFAVLGEFLATEQNDRVPVFALAGFQVGPTLSEAGSVSRGLCFEDNGWLERIVEILELHKHGTSGRYTDEAGTEQWVPADGLVSMNMWGFTPAIFAELEARFVDFITHSGTDDSHEFLLPDVVQGMINDGSARVRVLRHGGRWCGITYPEDRERVRAFINDLVAQGEYPARLWADPRDKHW